MTEDVGNEAADGVELGVQVAFSVTDFPTGITRIRSGESQSLAAVSAATWPRCGGLKLPP